MASTLTAATDRPPRVGGHDAVVALAAALAGVGVMEGVLRAATEDLTLYGSLALVAVSAGATLPLAVANRIVAASAVAGACAVALALFAWVPLAGLLAVLVAVYRGDQRAPGAAVHRLVAVWVALPLPVLALVRTDPGWEGWITVALTAVAPGLAIAGAYERARLEARARMDDFAALTGVHAASSAQAERARIARELHDVVAHHISMVAVQAETTRLTTPAMPEAGSRQLLAIGDTARAALTEMRRLLGVLRDDAEAPVVERRPQPRLADLADLVDEARDAAGSRARLTLRGAPTEVSDVVEVAAYRIAQEALTNARRHAPGAAVDVEVVYEPGALQVRVRDNGPGPPTRHPTGLGLRGMHERAAAADGTVRTGEAAGGGFVVEASFPAAPAPRP